MDCVSTARARIQDNLEREWENGNAIPGGLYEQASIHPKWRVQDCRPGNAHCLLYINMGARIIYQNYNIAIHLCQRHCLRVHHNGFGRVKDRRERVLSTLSHFDVRARNDRLAHYTGRTAHTRHVNNRHCARTRGWKNAVALIRSILCWVHKYFKENTERVDGAWFVNFVNSRSLVERSESIWVNELGCFCSERYGFNDAAMIIKGDNDRTRGIIILFRKNCSKRVNRNGWNKI